MVALLEWKAALSAQLALWLVPMGESWVQLVARWARKADWSAHDLPGLAALHPLEWDLLVRLEAASVDSVVAPAFLLPSYRRQSGL